MMMFMKKKKKDVAISRSANFKVTKAISTGVFQLSGPECFPSKGTFVMKKEVLGYQIYHLLYLGLFRIIGAVWFGFFALETVSGKN
jgi:hypothetical protein